MRKLKSVPDKHKLIIAIIIFAILSSVLLSLTPESNMFDNKVKYVDKISTVILRLEYGDTPKDTYAIKYEDGSEAEVNMPKDIDTMKIGTTEHKLDTPKGEVVLKVIIKDTQIPTIDGENYVRVKTNTSNSELESLLNEVIEAKDPIDGPLSIKYISRRLNLSKNNKYSVTVMAKDDNHNRNSMKIVVEVMSKDNFDKGVGTEEYKIAEELKIQKKKENAKISAEAKK